MRLIDADEMLWHLTHWVDKSGFSHEVNQEAFTTEEIEDAIQKTDKETEIMAIEFLQSTGWMQEHDRILTESAQPERKIGTWIQTDELWTDMFTADEERIYKCSVCGENVIGKPDWRFCPCCGAYMRGNKNE